MTLATTRVPDCLCPLCGERMSAATNMTNEDKPAPGDATLCIECATVLVFDADMQLRLMSDAQWQALSVQDRTYLENIRRALILVRRRSARP